MTIEKIDMKKLSGFGPLLNPIGSKADFIKIGAHQVQRDNVVYWKPKRKIKDDHQ